MAMGDHHDFKKPQTLPEGDVEEETTDTSEEEEEEYDNHHKPNKGLKRFFRRMKRDATSILFSKGELSRVFSEDVALMEKQILDPRGPLADQWRKLFLGACLLSLFVDPLFFYAPTIKDDVCVEESVSLKLALTIIRSLIDAFYIVNMYIRFRTAYVAPSSRIFGTGELVTDPKMISANYLSRDFWFDFVASLPFPQVLIWIAFPKLGQAEFLKTKHAIRLVIILQFLLRLYLTIPLSSRIIQATGNIMEKAWAGAAFNLGLFMLASHVVGSCWYLLSIEREEDCWTEVCRRQSRHCQYWFPNCNTPFDIRKRAQFNSTSMSIFCNPEAGLYEFGIYAEALSNGITTSKFFNKFFYSFWWGMRQLSSLGQGLQVSTYVGEIGFAMVIGILGLVLFALLIGNMQMYLQSTTKRIEEWRVKRGDAEVWMRHRQLPHELKQRVRRYHHYKWVATGGFDEEQILEALPLDLRREIKRNLYSHLVRRVPLFDEMDDQMLDAICERLRSALYIQGSCLLSEGAPVNQMSFIIRGRLDSFTTAGGRAGFFNTCCIGPGDFCGEELLTWAMVPNPNQVIPSSTRTVKCISEVEALALTAEDLRLVASQFRRQHWKHLRPTFRASSQQWRTWAATFIQASWSSYKKRRLSAELKDGRRRAGLETVPERRARSLHIERSKSGWFGLDANESPAGNHRGPVPMDYPVD